MPSHKTCECLPTPRTARRTRRRPLAPPPARLAPTAPSPPWERSFSLGRGAEQLLRRVRSPREEDPGEEAEAEPAGSAVDPFPHRQHRAPPSRLPQTSAPFGSRSFSSMLTCPVACASPRSGTTTSGDTGGGPRSASKRAGRRFMPAAALGRVIGLQRGGPAASAAKEPN